MSTAALASVDVEVMEVQADLLGDRGDQALQMGRGREAGKVGGGLTLMYQSVNLFEVRQVLELQATPQRRQGGASMETRYSFPLLEDLGAEVGLTKRTLSIIWGAGAEVVRFS